MKNRNKEAIKSTSEYWMGTNRFFLMCFRNIVSMLQMYWSLSKRWMTVKIAAAHCIQTCKSKVIGHVLEFNILYMLSLKIILLFGNFQNCATYTHTYAWQHTSFIHIFIYMRSKWEFLQSSSSKVYTCSPVPLC